MEHPHVPLPTFSFRLGNLEAKTEQGGIHINQDTASGYKISLAYFTHHEEGWKLQFVGRRPFEPDVNANDFWLVALTAQAFLDREFEKGA